MIQSIRINPSIFAQAFRRFQTQVEQAEESPGAFHDFQSGLAYSMEHYKEWLYLEARRRLAVETWMEKQVGAGAILKRVIQAIEIHEDKDHRNNIVEWQGRKGPGSKSTLKLLKAQDDRRERLRVEKALWQMYAMQGDPKACFEQLVALLGARYDLISYLFFIRDWNHFMPVKSSFFPEVFDLLGVPHPMVKRCNWENYSGVMARLREVQRHLQGYNIPNGVRLIDAHSFCWMLNSLPEPREKAIPPRPIEAMVPEAVAAPPLGATNGHTNRDDLDEMQQNQRRIGDLAQRIVLDAERARLNQEGRRDLARRVKDVSDNLSLGYDIESFMPDGTLKPIEVKATAVRGVDCRFFLSQNEKRQARQLPNFHFVLVFELASKKPLLHEFAGRDLPDDALYPIQYEVRLKSPGK